METRSGAHSEMDGIDVDRAWALLLALRDAVRRDGPTPPCFALGCNPEGRAMLLERSDPGVLVMVEADGGWRARGHLGAEVAAMFDLYLPVALACARRPLVLAHLGMSLDGHIATHAGASHYVTGNENIVHLHRLRALVDAVVVGANTVELDDPQLTTRRVPGGNPVRVVIDPDRRLGGGFRVFSDSAAETLVFCAAAHAGPRNGMARTVGLPAGPNGLPLDALVERLRGRGLHAILVEGGGITVSRFLAQDSVDRLQLAVAPLLIGEGRAALRLPPVDSLAQARRPRCRHFRMGEDMLFDCDLRDDG
jgi:diaminohydroxyphosphoribosylaminopyrimidine deaminase/5-amino-6-(5-phosphoribosylamino)uracil reductase